MLCCIIYSNLIFQLNQKKFQQIINFSNIFMVGIQILDCVLLFQDYDMLYTNKSLNAYYVLPNLLLPAH